MATTPTEIELTVWSIVTHDNCLIDVVGTRDEATAIYGDRPGAVLDKHTVTVEIEFVTSVKEDQ